MPDSMVLCADLVPVYHLGQSQLLTFWGPEKLSRRWRASIGIFWGAWGLPLPRRHPIISLVGAPIPGELLYFVCSLGVGSFCRDLVLRVPLPACCDTHV